MFPICFIFFWANNIQYRGQEAKWFLFAFAKLWDWQFEEADLVKQFKTSFGIAPKNNMFQFKYVIKVMYEEMHILFFAKLS